MARDDPAPIPSEKAIVALARFLRATGPHMRDFCGVSLSPAGHAKSWTTLLRVVPPVGTEELKEQKNS